MASTRMGHQRHNGPLIYGVHVPSLIMRTLSGPSRLDQLIVGRLEINSLVTPRASNSRALVPVETKSTAPTIARRLTAYPTQILFALLRTPYSGLRAARTRHGNVCTTIAASLVRGRLGRTVYQIKPVIWPKLDCALCAHSFQNF
ncbi:hypothetical protein MY5147_003939 [Beauveria neobassiana]|uniref:Uncharacterized protein n=1 Tax=Beauveria bassiana D1-5 TaxID=1245745 RepID=A0A0A2VJG9_BEABA|nr:hypothetical protein BBAD15_g8407 [Beauveria bassiana D1-5]